MTTDPNRARTITRRLTAKVLTYFSQNEVEQLRLLRQRLLDFANSNKTHTDSQINHWHMARRAMEKDGAGFNSAFLMALEKNISDDIHNQLNETRSTPTRSFKGQTDSGLGDFTAGLSLVGADEMDRMLQHDRVVQRFNSRYEDALTSLNQRMRVLLGNESATLQGNPYRPELMIRSFTDALGAIGVHGDIAEDALLVLDPRHWIDLAPLYNDLDNTGSDSGVAAEKHRVRKAGGSDSGSNWPGMGGDSSTHSRLHGTEFNSTHSTHGEFGPVSSAASFPGSIPVMYPGSMPGMYPSGLAQGYPTAAAGGYPGSGVGAYPSGATGTYPAGTMPASLPGGVPAGYGVPAGWSGSSHAREFLRQLHATRGPVATSYGAPPISSSGRFSGWAPPGTGAAQVPLEPYLISYLEELQARAVDAMGIGNFDFDLQEQNVLRQIREEEHIQSARELDRGTVDALAEVFDFVFSDANIPAPLKVIIGKLQIPVLKAAMLDRDFFLSENHPARRLIDALAANAVAWSPDKGVDDPLYLQIERSVKRILNEFLEDLALFSEVLLEFEEFLAELDHEAAEQVVEFVSEEEAEEALLIARTQADHALRDRVLSLSTELAGTAYLIPFLTNQWRDVLASALLDQDESPDMYTYLLAITDQLVWSTQHKSDAIQRRQLIELLPSMVRQINASLDQIGWQGEERETFTRRLIATHMNALRSGPDDVPDTAPNSQDRQASEDAVRALDERIAEAQETEIQGADASTQNLDRGMWFDFLSEEGHVLRCRLTWISPKRTRFLFTNRDGFEAFVRSEREVREWLHQGRLRALSQEPIVARALDQIMGEAPIDPSSLA